MPHLNFVDPEAEVGDSFTFDEIEDAKQLLCK